MTKNSAKPILIILLTCSLTGCIQPRARVYNTESNISMSEKAHLVCKEYGAKQGTRMFYNCMRTQMRQEKYSRAMQNCNARNYTSCIRESLFLDIGMKGVEICKIQRRKLCEQRAETNFLNQKTHRLDIKEHTYNHSYIHTYTH